MKITRLDPQTRDSTADSWTLSRACRRLVIGRAAPADIRLESPAISPQHAELSWQGGFVTIRDLASINGIAAERISGNCSPAVLPSADRHNDPAST